MVNKRERLERAGAWLRSTRQRRGYHSAGEFAMALGVDSSMVSRYERGDSEVSDERAEAIAEVLGLSIIEVRDGLGLWVPDEERVERIADETLGYDLDALRNQVVELLEHLDEILNRHVGDPEQAGERAQRRRVIARGPDMQFGSTLIDVKQGVSDEARHIRSKLDDVSDNDAAKHG